MIRFGLHYFFVRRLSPDLEFPRTQAESPPAGDPVWKTLPYPNRALQVVVLRSAHVSAAFRTKGGVVLGASYTRPEFRGQGLFRQALSWLCARMAREGVREVFVSCNVFNAASRRAILAAGFRYHRAAFDLKIGALDLGHWIDAFVRRLRGSIS